MGEAKRNRERLARMVWHHTSTLRTNQLWMSGYILPEGKMPPVLHPKLGEIHTDATMRRPMKDFPPLVWLTSKIAIPNVLLNAGFYLGDTRTEMPMEGVNRVDLSNALALNRMGLGFAIDDVPSLVRWPDHPGYATGEGRDLNDTARDAGDDPDDWWVSEEPIDILGMIEIRGSKSIMKPRLEVFSTYLADVHRMVRGCRENPGIFIPPSWLTPAEARAFAQRVGVPVKEA